MKKIMIRPPIVAVLGHVDHGKTTLLDAIRKTRVQTKEVGGITQSIGASVATTKDGERVTFIDTPGHAAFSKMRSSGTNAADIAILVVAANDGVKPQTVEAMKHIKDANLPYIVALTKVDLKTASIEKTLDQLEKEGIAFDGKGGDIPFVEVSGKERRGLDDLLDMIVLVAQVNEIKGDKDAPLEAVVIETSKGKGGILVSVVVKKGALRKGQDISSGGISCRVKGMFDDIGNSLNEVAPGGPAQILGFSEQPYVGWVVTDVQTGQKEREKDTKGRSIGKLSKDEVGVVVKAQSIGSLEAVLGNLPEKIVVIDSGVGEVNESDVVMAKSANAMVFAFESKIQSSVLGFAKTEGVIIESYDLIYKLLERMEELVEGKKEKVEASAKIIAEFPYNSKKVAGCTILEGEIVKGSKLKLARGTKDLGVVRVRSIKKVKQEVSKAKKGEECGIIFTPQLDFAIGDMLLSVRK